MAKLEIIGPKSHFFEVLSVLHEQGTLHIEDLSKKIQAGEVPLDKMELVANQQQDRDRMENMLIRLRSIIKALHLPSTKVDTERRSELYGKLWDMESDQLEAEIARVIEEVEDRTSALSSSQSSLEGEIALLARYEPILEKIQPLAKQIVTTGGFDSVALLIERRYKGALEHLKAELDKLTKKQCEIVSTDVDEETTAAIVVFDRAYSEAVHRFLSMENVNQIRLPADLQDMPFYLAYQTVKERQKNLPGQLKDVQSELGEMSERWYTELLTIRDVLKDKIDELTAIPKFGQTEYAFVITGWTPVDNVKSVKQLVSEHFGQDIIVNQLAIDEHEFDETPVALKNPKAVAPYSFLVSYVSGMPKYGTVDPTWFVAIFYPLLFGMIVGDIGYGAVMLAMVIWLRLKFGDKEWAQIATSILGPAATMATAFGFVYGEFFGDGLARTGIFEKYPLHIGNFMLPFERTTTKELVTMFMIVSLAVGFIQIVVGLVLGVINGIRTKHKSHVFEKGGILTVVMGAVFVAIASILNQPPVIQIIAVVVMLVGLYFAFKGGKVIGVIETIEAFTKMASYIRVMAVGLAGAIFAEAVNEMMGQMPLAMGIILGVILHALNIAIAAFSPNVHAVRLQIVEFFGRFYEAGGEEYRPFQKTGGEKSA